MSDTTKPENVWPIYFGGDGEHSLGIVVPEEHKPFFAVCLDGSFYFRGEKFLDNAELAKGLWESHATPRRVMPKAKEPLDLGDIDPERVWALEVFVDGKCVLALRADGKAFFYEEEVGSYPLLAASLCDGLPDGLPVIAEGDWKYVALQLVLDDHR